MTPSSQAAVLEQRSRELASARRAVVAAANKIRLDFGSRNITAYKGRSDVQLRADLVAQRTIVAILRQDFPDYGIFAEEGLESAWPDTRHTWLIDPLDGTNNFGYGIAHCAIVVALFHSTNVALSLVYDPILEREYFATVGDPRLPCISPEDQLARATISLVTGYSQSARRQGRLAEASLENKCKRTLSLWAPALDLALVSTGKIDGMVCIGAKLLDVCAGLHLVQAAGGTTVQLDGRPLILHSGMWSRPVSFVAASSPRLARELLASLPVGRLGPP